MKKITVLLLGVACLFLAYLYSRVAVLEKNAVSSAPTPIARQESLCTPAFVDGGGPFYKSGAPMRRKIAPPDAKGAALILRGKLLASDCTTPINGAVLDFWQADENGVYPDNWYRGKVTTNPDGGYLLETVIPKGYGEGTGYRPPHIHFKVFIHDREIITSQMFFPEAKGKPGFDDAYIMKLEEETVSGKKQFSGYHDIILPEQ